jgi:hypothetical protein
VFEQWKPAAEQALTAIGVKVTWDNMQMPDYQTNAPNYPMFISFLAMDGNASRPCSGRSPASSGSTRTRLREQRGPRAAREEGAGEGRRPDRRDQGPEQGSGRPGLVVGLVPGGEQPTTACGHQGAADRRHDVPDAALHHQG